MSELLCWNCGHDLADVPRPISRHATCDSCFNELHCCRLCRHFDPADNMQCFEDRADPPLQKENANFCDFFSPKSGAFKARTADRSDSARANLDALFGEAAEEDTREEGEMQKPTTESLTKEDTVKRRLDDLFN